MPIGMDRDRIPSHFRANGNGLSVAAADDCHFPSDSIRIALVNNMPDAALEGTEAQFVELLAAAVGDLPVRLGLYSLPEIPRGEHARQHLHSFYGSIGDLFGHGADAVIVTGTEPLHSDLRQEPYWGTLAELLDWAENHTESAVLSCLATHAGVLHSDGIPRHPLKEKQFGIFEERIVNDHPLIEGIASPIRIAHSRWNEVREAELASRGYLVLTRSAGAGVNLFVKRKKRSLFVHFQGHPEYGARTLLKEYRRDIGRFLKKERGTYPSVPVGYFDAASEKLLVDFQTEAMSNPREELLNDFPETAVAGSLQHTWRRAAAGIYRNWLHYIESRKTNGTKANTVASANDEPWRDSGTVLHPIPGATRLLSENNALHAKRP